jgi:Ca2+-binding EF-hand superfamily protein
MANAKADVFSLGKLFKSFHMTGFEELITHMTKENPEERYDTVKVQIYLTKMKNEWVTSALLRIPSFKNMIIGTIMQAK